MDWLQDFIRSFYPEREKVKTPTKITWETLSEAERMQVIRRFNEPGIAAKYNLSDQQKIALKQIQKTIEVEGKIPEHINLEQPEDLPPIKVEIQPDDTLDDVLYELHNLIGLENVKEEVKTLINFVKVQKARKEKDLKATPISYHCVFTGSPGTGKTTIARLIARIYKHLGVIEKGHLIETDRSGLVAEYAGQTATKVDKVVKSALGGVLFIDEAYSLVGTNDDYGKEAVAALIKRMEDHRDNLVLIVAGYPYEMEDFIDTNPGFKSRFNRYIEFEDYSAEELMSIFKLFCGNAEYELTEDAEDALEKRLNQLVDEKDENFGNGRLVRNMFEKTIENQSNRIVQVDTLTREMLTTIEEYDIQS